MYLLVLARIWRIPLHPCGGCGRGLGGVNTMGGLSNGEPGSYILYILLYITIFCCNISFSEKYTAHSRHEERRVFNGFIRRDSKPFQQWEAE